MAGDNKSPDERKVKTLAIRLDPDLHAQLSVIAQLRGSTITDEIREALGAHVESLSASEDLAGSAASMLDEIEREADARREALSTLFGSAEAKPKAARRTSGRKTTTEDDSATS